MSPTSGHHPFDAAQMFKSSGNVTKSGSSSAIKVRTTPFSGMAALIHLPTSPDATTTLLIRVLASDNGTTYKEIARDEEPGTHSTGIGHSIVIPFGTRKKYVMLGWTISATGSANFGAVKAGLVPYIDDWERNPVGIQ